MLWGTDFRWVKKPKLEDKWFFPGNKHAWLLIRCNFLLYLVKTAIPYLFHIPPSTDAPQSVHVASTTRAAWRGRGGCAERGAGRVCSPHAALLAALIDLPPAQDNGVLQEAAAGKASLSAVSPAEGKRFQVQLGKASSWPHEKLDSRTS